MSMIAPIIEEFTQESAQTRRLLERVPDAHWDWKPHEKSMSMGALASHIAENPGWVGVTLEMDEMDPVAMEYQPYVGANIAEVLELFDAKTAEALAAMKGATDEQLMGIWRMKMDGELKFEMPRIAVLRLFILSHTAHHRGQLTVYLRIHDVPLPSIYGPTADEQP
jgi:uncharacterized damage-inducible protein DinB